MDKKLSSLFRRFPALSLSVLIVSFTGIEGTFSFCSKVTCPPFADANFDQWFPYKPKEVIIFTSNLNKQDTITIEEASKSTAHTATGRGNCSMDASIRSVEAAGATRKLTVDYYKYPQLGYLYFYLYDMQLTTKGIGNTGLMLDSDLLYQSQYYANATINGTAYTAVQLVQRDTITNRKAGVYKLWLAKDKGLIAYAHYPDGETWSR